MSNYTIKCILCKTSLRNLDGRDTSELLQPEEGVIFKGEGHYGSGFDLSATMVIGICDDCLTTALSEDVVIKEEVEKVIPKRTYTQVSSRKDVYDPLRDW